MIYKLLGVQRNRAASPFRQQRSTLLPILLLYTTICGALAYLIHQLIPQPYMDQQFHLDQLDNYLQHNFTYYNDKLTTPPALYILNLLPVKYLTAFTGMSSLLACRLINAVVYNGIILFFLHQLYARNLGHESRPLFRAFLLTLTPTIFFYHFLFYTDSASLAFLLMSHYYTGHSGPHSLISGFLAIFTRQTNIIWIVYSAVQHYLNSKSQAFQNSETLVLPFLRHCWNDRKLILSRYFWQLVLLVLFLAFFYQNNFQVVIGDQSNHQPSLHLAQLCYLPLFLSTTIPTTWPPFLSTLLLTLSRLFTSRNALATFLLLCSLSIVVIDRFTIWHPFVYSDNRHYVFYLYKRFFRDWGIWAVPGYVMLAVCMFRMVVKTKAAILGYFLWLGACAMVLVPSSLVELRYFTPPLVMYSMLPTHPPSSPQQPQPHPSHTNPNPTHLLTSILLRILTNFSLLYIFTMMPIYPSVRFIF